MPPVPPLATPLLKSAKNRPAESEKQKKFPWYGLTTNTIFFYNTYLIVAPLSLSDLLNQPYYFNSRGESIVYCMKKIRTCFGVSRTIGVVFTPHIHIYMQS
jgi:hypothetical protein